MTRIADLVKSYCPSSMLNIGTGTGAMINKLFRRN